MIKQIQMVREFNTKFKKFVGDPSKPSLDVPENVLELRERIIREETEEIFDAVKKKDLINLAKEYSDALVVIFGGIVEHGLDYIIEDAFRLTHESNMSKLDNDGNPVYREDGKVIKGPNYKKPDLSVLFKKTLNVVDGSGSDIVEEYQE